MEYTGERMIPAKADVQTYWEHIYRYRFAAQYAAGRRVLDIACGEGYGTAALLAVGAQSVIGVDIDPAACEHAKKMYGVETRVGSALSIPVESKSIDLLVSFETIEHISDHERFLDECVRVLTPGGVIIISTPDTERYSAYYKFTNPFHARELTQREFHALLQRKFLDVRLFDQMPTRYLIRGMGRMSRLAKTGRVGMSKARKLQSDPVSAITQRADPLGKFLNPFAVSRPAWWRGFCPIYLVAVASVEMCAR